MKQDRQTNQALLNELGRNKEVNHDWQLKKVKDEKILKSPIGLSYITVLILLEPVSAILNFNGKCTELQMPKPDTKL